MDVRIDIKGISGVEDMLKAVPGKAHRACAVAMNQTGKAIKEAEIVEMRRVFDRPVPFTLNSLQLTTASKSDLTAMVGFKSPARMGQHYLVPQVEGGARKLKGFERGIGKREFVPGKGARLDRYGNVPGSQIVQIMSVLGKLGRYAGDNTNITARSRKRNAKQRDYVFLPHSHGKLPPGIYQRFKVGGNVTAKRRRIAQQVFDTRVKLGLGGRRGFVNPSDKSLSYERGKVRAVIKARGLRPILIAGRTGHAVKPLLDFYGVANKTFDRVFSDRFWSTFNRFLSS